MIKLSINGVPHDFAAPLTVTELIAELQLGGKRIAIECNGEIVPKSLHSDTQLSDGDVLEMVVAVGGG